MNKVNQFKEVYRLLEKINNGLPIGCACAFRYDHGQLALFVFNDVVKNDELEQNMVRMEIPEVVFRADQKGLKSFTEAAIAQLSREVQRQRAEGQEEPKVDNEKVIH